MAERLRRSVYSTVHYHCVFSGQEGKCFQRKLLISLQRGFSRKCFYMDDCVSYIGFVQSI